MPVISEDLHASPLAAMFASYAALREPDVASVARLVRSVDDDAVMDALPELRATPLAGPGHRPLWEALLEVSARPGVRLWRLWFIPGDRLALEELRSVWRTKTAHDPARQLAGLCEALDSEHAVIEDVFTLPARTAAEVVERWRVVHGANVLDAVAARYGEATPTAICAWWTTVDVSLRALCEAVSPAPATWLLALEEWAEEGAPPFAEVVARLGACDRELLAVAECLAADAVASGAELTVTAALEAASRLLRCR